MVEVHIPKLGTMCTFPKIGRGAFLLLGEEPILFKESGESEISFFVCEIGI